MTGFNFAHFFLIMVCISFCSLNVNGLRNDAKRRQIFSLLNDQNLDIVLLQETHICNFSEARAWALEFGGKGFWSFGSSLSCSTGILLSNKRHVWETVDFHHDSNGRAASVTVKSPSLSGPIRIIMFMPPLILMIVNVFSLKNSLCIAGG